jgi:two-component system capsular synthesis sensor histidine kinase RcsC
VELLREEGYTVLQAVDGSEAIDLLSDALIVDDLGLLILDMNLPYVDGVGVLRHLAERGWTIPVIAMSAAPLYLERARRQGVRQTLEKPFGLDRFLDTVRHAREGTAVSLPAVGPG